VGLVKNVNHERWVDKVWCVSQIYTRKKGLRILTEFRHKHKSHTHVYTIHVYECDETMGCGSVLVGVGWGCVPLIARMYLSCYSLPQQFPCSVM